MEVEIRNGSKIQRLLKMEIERGKSPQEAASTIERKIQRLLKMEIERRRMSVAKNSSCFVRFKGS